MTCSTSSLTGGVGRWRGGHAESGHTCRGLAGRRQCTSSSCWSARRCLLACCACLVAVLVPQAAALHKLLLHGSCAVCRGWLLRLLGPVRDQEDFNRLDQLLVNGLQQAGVDTSQPPLTELSAALTYQPQQQQLEGLMKQLGIARLLRDPLSATLRLQSMLNHLPSGSNIEVLLQQEIDFYQSGFLQYTERLTSNGDALASMDLGSRAGSGSDSGVPKGPSGSSTQQQLRRSSSSSGPLLAGRARAAAMAAVEPYMVLRNDTVRAEWRSTFGSRERITWKEFWHKLVHPQVGATRALVCWHTPLAAAHMSWLCSVPDACCDDCWPCASPRHTCR